MPIEIRRSANWALGNTLDSVLNNAKLSLDYFKFADTFKSNQSVTNCHYKDLLKTLSNGQSNKLTKIVSIAKSLFDVIIYYLSAMHAANINKLLGTK